MNGLLKSLKAGAADVAEKLETARRRRRAAGADAAGPLTGRVVQLPGALPVRVEALVGEGGAASVYRAVDPATREAFALKHFVLGGDAEAEAGAAAELAALCALADCPDVVRLRAADVRPGAREAFLLLELCEPGSLAELVAAEHPAGMPPAAALAAWLPVCRAVAACHALVPPLAHRDVKAENALRRRGAAGGGWVLCDFGSAAAEAPPPATAAARAAEEARVQRTTTPAYRAPELCDLLSRVPVGVAVDNWALGCLLHLLLYGRLPFAADARLRILEGRFELPPGRPPALEALVRDQLVVDPARRLSAREAAARGEAAARALGEPPPPLEEWSREFAGLAPPAGGGSGGSGRRPGSGGSGQWATFDSPGAAAASAAATEGPFGAAAAAAAAAAALPPHAPPPPAGPPAPLMSLATPPGAAAAGAGGRAARAEAEEHARVLEQLLEARTAEARALKRALEERGAEAARLLSALAAAEAAARRAAAERDSARGELRAARARLADADAALARRAPAGAAGGSRPESRGADAVASFPLDADLPVGRPAMPGSPMRGARGSGGAGAGSPSKAAARARGRGPSYGDGAFQDLDPLA
jgi:hypothetical protein